MATDDSGEASVLSIASNAGMALWIDGVPTLRSRYARRGLNRHTDLVAVPAEHSRGIALYRVVRGGSPWQLYRERRSASEASELLGYAIDHGAYADLPLRPIIPDSVNAIELKRPRVALPGTPTVAFRWYDLLGEPLEDLGSWTGALPGHLPLPEAWDGAAVLVTEVTDPADGRVLYREHFPLFSEGRAAKLAAELVGTDPGTDPILRERITSVRRFFGLDEGSSPGSASLRALTLAGLYRIVRDPEGYARYPGPQVWAFQKDDGGVVPYWVTVPPGLDAPGAAPEPVVFSVHHLVDPDYWRGRGAYPGHVVQQATLSGSVGGFGVLPHLEGSHDFGLIGASELPAITRQLAEVLPVDTSRVGLLVWSQHAGGALTLAVDPRVPLSHLTLAVPDVDPRMLNTTLFSLQRARPGLRVELWSGAEDQVIPPRRVEALTEEFRERGFDVDHVRVPYSRHLEGLMYDVHSALRRALSGTTPGSAAAGFAGSPPP